MENKLIILLVIILGAIAIAQLVRVYELSSKLRKSGEHEISTRDNNLNAKMMLGFMLLFFASVVYLFLKSSILRTKCTKKYVFKIYTFI
jgi:cytochrome c oxidase subunit 2